MTGMAVPGETPWEVADDTFELPLKHIVHTYPEGGKSGPICGRPYDPRGHLFAGSDPRPGMAGDGRVVACEDCTGLDAWVGEWQRRCERHRRLGHMMWRRFTRKWFARLREQDRRNGYRP